MVCKFHVILVGSSDRTQGFENNNYHPYVSAEHRSWSYRKPLLLKRIFDMDVDVLCCQEAANEEMSLTSELEEVWIPMEMC